MVSDMKRGFTLLELAVVLAVVALIVGGGMATLTASTQQSAYNSTVATMNAIDKAIYNFSTAYGRIPCPSDPRLKPSDTNYGVEAGNTTPGAGVGYLSSAGPPAVYIGECITGMTPAANLGTSAMAEEGGVPTRALKLPDSYMYDGWGHKIRYGVNPDYTIGVNNTNGRTSWQVPNNVCNSSSRAITVYDSTGTARTTNAMYVLVSQGSSGHGAYTMYGGTTLFNANNSNTDTQKNCNCNGTAVSNTAANYTHAYTQTAPYYSSGHNNDPAYYFDDIVSFREPWQQVNISNNSTANTSCSSGGGNSVLWLTDYDNGRVVEFSMTTGAPITSIGSLGSLANQFNRTGSTAVDKSGNVWIIDTYGNRLVKYDKDGNLKLIIGGVAGDTCGGSYTKGSTGCSNISGQTACCANDGATTCSCTTTKTQGALNIYGNPSQITFDASGNVWVTDYGHKWVQEFDSTTGANKNVFSLASNPGGLAIDQNGYFWVMVPGNHTLYRCDPSYTCTAKYSGFAASSTDSDYIYIQNTSGTFYVWVVDESNGVIRKFDSNGNYLTNFPSTSFGGYTGITFDINGYAWISSESTNSLYKLDPSTGATMPGYPITAAYSTSFGAPQLSYYNAR